MLKICSKSFRWKPRRLAPDASQSQQLHPSNALQPQSPPPRPVAHSSKSPSRKKGYGLELLYDGTDCQDGMGVDIVAIHGLNGNAYTTWKSKNGILWLRDLLPQDLPGARIYTYGYPAEVLFSKSVGDIIDFSRRFLSELKGQLMASSQNNKAPRPIIFVCHSLGGLVCKQALLLASEQNSHYEDILGATSAVVFLGTPHRGSKIADTAKAVGDLANSLLRVTQVTAFTGAIRSDLVSTLSAGSDKLQVLAESFHDRLDHLGIVTFYEQEITSPLSSVVVDRESAIMGIPGEQVIPLHADHRNMCRFDERNKEYNTVVTEIRRLAQETKPSRKSATMSLQSTEKRCMSLLYSTNLADYKTSLPKPVRGTCSWILSDPQYISWVETEETGLLWVTGEPGCGKTMLSVYLTENMMLTPTVPPHSQVFYFFCDDKVTAQRNAKEILRSILHQILQQNRKLIKYAKSRWEATGSSLVESFAALWEIFLRIVVESRLGPVGIIVDGIDECEADTRRTFLQAIKQLVQDSRTAVSRPRNFVKFLVTSRPSLQDLGALDGLRESILPIDENQARISQDISIVIRSRFGQIAKRAALSDEARVEIEDLLNAKAEKSFLWLNIVLQSLESSASTSRRDFKRIIDEFPRELEATYAGFLFQIPEGRRKAARDLLRLLIGSSRHLTLDEINIAYTIHGQDYRTVTQVTDDHQNAMERMLLDIVGPFIRVEESRVSLIHQTVKDFLADGAPLSSDNTIREFGIPPAVAALNIASTCIQYLLLDDFTTDIFVADSYPPDPIMEENDSDLDVDSSDFPDLNLGPLMYDGENLDTDFSVLISQRYVLFDYAATHWAKHFSQCESIAPKETRQAAQRLLQSNTCVLKNWLKFFWFKTDMEFAVPDDFDDIMVAAFFDWPILLDESLGGPNSIDQARKDRALFWAARMGSARTLGVLLAHGANPNSREPYEQTPLAIASHHGHLEAVKVLLVDTRTDINARGKSGRSPLSFAAGNSHLEVFQLLFKHEHCRPHAQDDNHWTPLFWAIERDHTTIARTLLGHAAVDINHVDRHGRSVLSWAAGEGFTQALHMLLRHPGIDVNLKDHDGRSPLLWAAANGQETVIDALMQAPHRVDRRSKDADHRSALSLACRGGHANTVKALLKYGCGADDEPDVDGWRPLAWALECNSPATVAALLAGRGVQLDHQDPRGRTALIWAANYGHADVVRMLLEQGADVRVVDDRGWTARDYAGMFGRAEVLRLFEGRDAGDGGSGALVGGADREK